MPGLPPDAGAPACGRSAVGVRRHLSDEVGEQFRGLLGREVTDPGDPGHPVRAQTPLTRLEQGRGRDEPITVAGDVQDGHAQRGGQRLAVPETVRPRGRAGDPPQVLDGTVGGAGDQDGPAHPRRGLGEVGRRAPGRARLRPHQAFDERAVPGLQMPFGPHRQGRPGQQPAVAVGRQRPGDPGDGRRMGGGHGNHRADLGGAEHRGVEGGDAALTLTDQHRVPFAQRADQAGEVGGEIGGVVSARGLVGVAVPPHVHGDGTESAPGQTVDLVPPGPPVLRETVHQQDQRAGSGLGEMETDAVRTDVPMGPGTGLAHGRGEDRRHGCAEWVGAGHVRAGHVGVERVGVEHVGVEHVGVERGATGGNRTGAAAISAGSAAARRWRPGWASPGCASRRTSGWPPSRSARRWSARAS